MVTVANMQNGQVDLNKRELVTHSLTPKEK